MEAEAERCSIKENCHRNACTPLVLIVQSTWKHVLKRGLENFWPLSFRSSSFPFIITTTISVTVYVRALAISRNLKITRDQNSPVQFPWSLPRAINSLHHNRCTPWQFCRRILFTCKSTMLAIRHEHKYWFLASY
jgi:hypothetical protein